MLVVGVVGVPVVGFALVVAWMLGLETVSVISPGVDKVVGGSAGKYLLGIFHQVISVEQFMTLVC